MVKVKESVRPVGVIKITDPHGYGYLPKILRREVGCEGRDEIPFFISANCVLLVRKDADIRKVLEGLDILKKDLLLRFEQKAGYKNAGNSL